MFEILLILNSFLSYSLGQQNPTISFITKEQVINIGDTIDLSCSVQYARDYPVIWAKINRENPGNNLFISKGSSLSVPDNRYSIRHDDASSTYTLQISKIQEIDAGHYQCQVVIGTASRVTADVMVYVRIPPVISDNSTRSVITSAGVSISLQCYATGFPQPTISWRRENNDLLPTGGALYRGNILIIHNITKNDRGTYYCIADNNVGKGARRNVGVEVEFAPQVTAPQPFYYQALQYDADLTCHVESFPHPSIMWLKDGHELQDSQHHQVSIFSTADEFTDTTLRVKRIEKKHFGKYICKSINKLGSHHQEIELRESSNVVCPPSCDIGFAGFAGTGNGLRSTSMIYALLIMLSLLYYI